MPLSYPDGTLAEHQACRHGAVAFDVSHLGTVRVEGPDALHRAAAGRSPTTSTSIGPGRAQYTHLLDPADASVLDDIIVWWVGAETLRRDAQRVQHRPGHRGAGRAAATPTRRRRHRDPGDHRRAGPRGPRAPGRGVSPRRPPSSRFHVAPVRVGRRRAASVAGTGYTGEDGVELRGAGRARAVPLWIAAARGRRSSRPAWAPATRCASRPACRCTATSSGPGITPLQAGLGWVVRWDKGDFRGRDALAGREGGRRRPAPARPGRRGPPAAPGRPGRAARRRSRSAWSPAATSRPSSGHGIALAFVPPDVEIGDRPRHRRARHRGAGRGRQAAVRQPLVSGAGPGAAGLVPRHHRSAPLVDGHDLGRLRARARDAGRPSAPTGRRPTPGRRPAPGPTPPRLAMLAHLGMLVGGFIVPAGRSTSTHRRGTTRSCATTSRRGAELLDHLPDRGRCGLHGRCFVVGVRRPGRC